MCFGSKTAEVTEQIVIMPQQCFGKHFAKANSKDNVKCFGIYFGTGRHIAEAKTKQHIKPFGFVQVTMVLRENKTCWTESAIFVFNQ